MSRLTSVLKRAKKRVRRTVQQFLSPSRHPSGRPVTASTFEEQIYSAAVRQGDVAYDIGANVGEVSEYLARLITTRGMVLSFEPVWSTYIELCRAVQQSDYQGATVVPLPYGLSDTDGAAKIAMPSGASGLASLRAIPAWKDLKRPKPHDEFTCELRRLDTLQVERNLPEPQFVKIDVEGAELLVLRGAQRSFSVSQPLLLIEVFAPWEAAFDYTPWDVFSLLIGWGYHFSFACPGGLVEHQPTQQQPFPENFKNGYNVIAYVPGKHADRLSTLRSLTAGSRGVLSMGKPPVPNVIGPAQRRSA